ncbi:MAG: aminomethyl-transferring glycine dehydrogenase subunit GcvPB [Christensenellaceae bacterium]|jgi:glycine dehydrogenase subunit 2
MSKDKLIFEKSIAGRRTTLFPTKKETKITLDEKYLRKQPAKLPEVAEVEVVRHYMELSKKAFGVDDGFYPLGSCTMKYNPKINEAIAGLSGFREIHPLQPIETVQGALESMYHMSEALNEISGMDATTLLPAAGAQGEWVGMQLIRAYHLDQGDMKRTKVIVPDSAHGTNPATAAMCGFDVINLPSTAEGYVDISALKEIVGEDTAALMLTNPNTLGLFEKDILEISKTVHEAGGLVYYDGANMNAIMGVTRPGDMGFDVVHWNVHKTLSTPHGGGGPGCGAVGCKALLTPYLPTPLVVKEKDAHAISYDVPKSIGAVKLFYGNFLVALKGYAYILSMGSAGLKEVSENAVLNANYMLQALKEYSDFAYPAPCMHEFVLSFETLKKETGIAAIDVAKAMIDAGMHPPTMYFPLILPEVLMFEPTETEARETLDHGIRVVKEIIAQAKENPDALHDAPKSTPVGRVDEVAAARNPVLRYEFSE